MQLKMVISYYLEYKNWWDPTEEETVVKKCINERKDSHSAEKSKDVS